MKMRLIFLSLAALLFAACGDSNSITPPAAEIADMSDIVVTGPITAFGSVVASGIEFSTDSTTVTMNGEPGTLDDLRIGMIVSIQGTINNTTEEVEASEISFIDDATGPITSINRNAATFVVLGRTVSVDELTVFEDATLDDLAPGNVVQVSGMWRHEEHIQATYVYRIANAYQAGMTMEVKGFISGLDIGAAHFNIGTQTCDFSAATLELGAADLADGLYVEASSSSPMSNGIMLLDRVQARDQDRDRDQLCDADCDFEIEGYITSFTSATDFEVDGHPVATDASTVYVNGTVDTLALDVKVAVDGMLDANDILVADRIVFRLPSVIEIEADVEAIGPDSGEITLLGIVVGTNDATLFQDHSTANVQYFGLDDLGIGDRVGLRAYEDAGSVIASRLSRYDAANAVTLKAPVDSVARPSITMLGVMATSDDNTVFQNADKDVITDDDFFTLVDVDSLVRVMGTYDGTSIAASKMFLRDCQNSNCL